MENSYFYVRNAQGDIIGLIDKAATQVVAYNYDSWGNMTPSKAETELYYLQSRYYNPTWGRFIETINYRANRLRDGLQVSNSFMPNPNDRAG